MADLKSPAQDRLLIGGWLADRSANELRQGAQTVRIEPKAMAVLLALAARAGEVVSREALLTSLWPGVVVGDEALTQSIIKLRRTLGDRSRAPTYIETIPKRGYRLIAPVRRCDPAPPAAEADGSAAQGAACTPGPVAAGRPMASWHRPALAALAIAVALVVAFRGAPAGPHPVTATATAAGAAATADAFDPAAEAKAGVVSVTVLPFVTLGGGTEQDYLAQGIGSDLVTDLSRLPGLRVIDLAGDASEARLARTVHLVVSGSVQRDATTLRVNVRLADARTHEPLWSLRLQRPSGDLLAIQNDISRGLVAQLPGRIRAAARAQVARRYTNHPAAYDDFLRAKALLLVRRPEANEQARVWYTKALEEDPQFARAYAGLAMSYAMEGRYRPAGDAVAALERAERLAASARLIDPDLPEVYWALGFVQVQGRRYGQAIASLQRAIQLNPSYADAYALLGGLYTYTGQAARSIPLLRTALRLNPDGGHLYFLLLGRAYLFENDPEQALINLREAAQRDPEDVETRIYLAATLVAAGDRSGAGLEADEVRSHDPGFSMAAWLDGYPLNRGPYRQRLTQLTSGLLSQGVAPPLCAEGRRAAATGQREARGRLQPLPALRCPPR